MSCRKTNRYSALPLGLTYVVTCLVFFSNLKLALYTHEGIQGRWCTVRLILTMGATWRRVVKVSPRPLYLRERTLVPNKLEDAGAPQSVWTVLGKEIFFACRNWNELFRPQTSHCTDRANPPPSFESKRTREKQDFFHHREYNISAFFLLARE